MNKGSLNRGDAGVIGAAILLFVSSFLNFYVAESPYGDESEGYNGWSNFWYPALPAIFLAGVIGAALVVGSRFLPENVRAKEFLGLRMEQWGTALAIFSLWSGFWMLFANPVGVGEMLDTGIGQILGLIAVALLAASVILTKLVPELQKPLIPAKPAGGPPPMGQPQGYGQQPQPGYGYPGPPSDAQPAAYGQQPGAPAQQQPAADPNFQPFWFAVPQQRPLYPEDGSQTPVAELTPGTWYLAVEQRGAALVAQTQDNRRGVLHDISDIQRG